MAEKGKLTIEDVRKQFFLNPRSDKEDVSKAQALFSILIGNVFDWYVCGQNYQSLKDAVNSNLKEKLESVMKERKTRSGKWVPDDSAPFVLNPKQDPSKIDFNIGLKSSRSSLEKSLYILDEDTVGTMRFNHHFIGELHPQGNLISFAASIIASFINENAIAPKVSPSVITWEREVVKWMWEMIWKETNNSKPPKGCDGHLVSGGSVANLTALFIAREKFKKWSAENTSVLQNPHPVILISPNSHYSIEKAAQQMGFERDVDVIKVKTKDIWKMDGEDVRLAIEEVHKRNQQVIMISALGGAADTGFVDDLSSISETIKKHNNSVKHSLPPIYFHVDASLGGPFIMLGLKQKSGEKKLFHGIETADAITIDGHKYFYCNYPCGGIFVKDGKDFRYLKERAEYIRSSNDNQREDELVKELASMMRKEGIYTKKEELPLCKLDEELELPAGFHTLEGSRGTQGVMSLYMILKIMNTEGLSVLLQHNIEMTKELRTLIKGIQKNDSGPALELLTDGPLNQTLFRFVYNWSKRSEMIDFDNKINRLIPYYLRWSQSGRLSKKQKPLNYYVGVDQLKFSTDKLKQFFDGVWKLNMGSSECPKNDWKNIDKWNRMHENSSTLHTLKAVITHPYTDKDTLKGYIESIIEAGQIIGKLLS